MTKKKQVGKNLTGENLIKLTHVKDDFLHVCKQYEGMGNLIKLQSKTLSHPLFSKSTAPSVLARIIEQYQEIGEQLKTLGAGLDEMGGDPVLKKKEEKKEEPKPQTFVSNIKPGHYRADEVGDTLAIDDKEEKGKE